MDPAHTAILHAWEGVFAAEFGKFPEITWRETPVGMAYAAARRVGDNVWVRSTDILMGNIHSITSVFEDGRTLKDCSPPWITIWTVPEDDESSHQFVLCHISEDDYLPAEARHRMMMYGQTYEERQKVPGDYDAMTSQGAIAPHSLENLGASDRGVSMFRRLLREGIRDVQSGRDPKGLIRSSDPQATYGSDLIVPASTVQPQADERTTLTAFAQSTIDGYLNSPPFHGRKIPKPPPLPVLAAAE